MRRYVAVAIDVHHSRDMGVEQVLQGDRRDQVPIVYEAENAQTGLLTDLFAERLVA